MNKKNRKIREEIEKNKKKMREMELHLQELNSMREQAENEEIIEVMREIVGKDGDVLEKLELFKQMNSQPRPTVPYKNHESEVEIDD